MNKIQIQDVNVVLNGSDIVNNISLEIKKGEIFGVIGPNGSGKTTLVRLLSGLLNPNSGQINVDDSSISNLSAKERGKLVAVVSQNPEYSPGFKVWDIVISGRNPHLGMIQRESIRDVMVAKNAMERVDVLHLSDRSIETLSGGERQRVFLARALTQESSVLILDEPTSNLDIGYQISIMEYIKEINQNSGITVFIAIHDLSVAGHYCDRIALINCGEVINIGTPEKVLNEETLSMIYGTNIIIVPHPNDASPMVVPKFNN